MSESSSPRFVRTLQTGGLVALVLAALGTSRDASADSLTVQTNPPDVLLLVDTSGSMSWALDGSCATFQQGSGEKARWSVIAETLTGSIPDLYSVSSGFGCGSLRYGSGNTNDWKKVCIPAKNNDAQITSALTTNKYGWPIGTTANKEQPVGFNKNGGAGGWCKLKGGGGEWNQLDDGLIDDYKSMIRFGAVAFDNDEVSDVPLTTSDVGYWFNSGADNWLTSANPMHNSYTDGVYIFSGFSQILKSENSFGTTQIYDVGMVNSRAHPADGRLIGFGPADWSATIAAGYCSSVSDCMSKHNEMVQMDVLGAGSYLSMGTPLAAMVRDASEFLLNDNVTTGVYLPHPATVDPTGKPELIGTIGLQTDSGFTGGCRQAAVILLTDGEPSHDLNVRMAKYTKVLYTNSTPIPVYVVGVGLDHAKWGPTNGAPSTENKACADLRDTDLDMDGSKPGDQMCEWDTGSGKWKFADVVVASDAEPGNIRACCSLLEAAVEGGTGKAYFPSTAAELKQNIGSVLVGLGGGSISRTMPVFGAATTASLSNGSVLAPAISYELRTSLGFDDKDKMWRGKIERVRYACDTSDLPEIQDVQSTTGDVFDANMDDLGSTIPRKFFTVVPKEAKELIGSLRIQMHPTLGVKVNDLDNLFRGGNTGDFKRQGAASTAGNDTLVTLSNWATTLDAANAGGKNDADDLLDVQGGDCNTYTGTSTKSTCADRILKWFGGADAPGGTTISRHAGSANCPAGRTCSPLGGIYHSSPVIVPPPQPFDSDEQNFGKTRSDGLTTSFYEKLGKRPTMVYSQTVDGMLHAFVLNKNDFNPSTNDFNTKVPAVETLDNNELWSFVPPAVMGQIFANFDKSTIQLDGQLAWGNVVYERPYGTDGTTSAAETANWDYKTVIVGASGRSSKQFYYALDVSDPLKPRFLWQLSSSGNKKDDGDGNDDDDGDGKDDKGDPGESLFGDSLPGAAITHIRYKEPSDNSEHIYAVAVLPGGSSNKSPGSPVARKRDLSTEDYWKPSDRKPRAKIRDWGKDVQARSLTFVELSTGRVLARMVGDWSDNPADKDGKKGKGKQQLLDEVTVDPANTKFDSPISGIPAPYPGGVGAIADRVYVGDQDGAMWRVEMPSTDPQTWRAFIAYDAYNNDGTLEDAWVSAGVATPAALNLTKTDDEAANMGQPIMTAPVLSVDENNNVVISYATGDQEDFNKVVNGMVNMTISVTDEYTTPNGAGMPPFQVTVTNKTGVEMAFLDGARVTGPLNLFDGQLFFSYFLPGTAGTCGGAGAGGICGVRYLDKDADTSPVEVMDFGGSTALDECHDFSDGEVVFGISVFQQPSCVDAAVPGFDDPWLSGKYSSMTQSNTGAFMLSYQTGQSGSALNKASTNSATKALPAPKSKTRVRTWVSLIE